MHLGPLVEKEISEEFIRFILDRKANNNVESYIAIKNAINFFSIPLARVICKKGQLVFRGRINENRNHFFTKDIEIGSRTEVNKILTFGRCNEPFQSLFYCSDNYYTACMETSKYSREAIEMHEDEETITIGLWEVQEDLILGVVPTHTSIRGKNKLMDRFHNYYVSVVAECGHVTPELLQVWDVLSKEFIMDVKGYSRDYLISCAFANYYFENNVFDNQLQKETQIDGILYPSVMYINEGVNFALRNNVYVEGNLVLKKAIKKTMVKTNANTCMDILVQKSKHIDQITGGIFW